MLALLVALLAAAPADRWSVYGGETVAAGQDVFHGEVGWPATSLGWTHGLTDTTDAGVSLDVLYAFETTTDSHFGLGLRVPLRAIAVRTGRVSLFVRGDPGFKIYPGNGTPWGLAIPLGGGWGFAVSPNVQLALGLDVPMTIFFAPRAHFVIGTQFGLGIDYFVDPRMVVGMQARFGPVFSTETTGSRLGLAYGYRGEAALPFSERFFAGGASSLRGFGRDLAGPVQEVPDPDNPGSTEFVALGGNALMVNNLELRFPIWGQIEGAVFYDLGNVFETVGRFRFSDLRSSLGFGLRYRTAVGPFRIDLGYNPDPRYEYEQTTVIHVAFGHAF